MSPMEHFIDIHNSVWYYVSFIFSVMDIFLLLLYTVLIVCRLVQKFLSSSSSQLPYMCTCSNVKFLPANLRTGCTLPNNQQQKVRKQQRREMVLEFY
jgi:hypothetical protein